MESGTSTPRGTGRGPTAPYTEQDAPSPYWPRPVRSKESAAASSSSSSSTTTTSIPTHLYQGLSPHFLLPDGTPDYLRLILSADIYSLVKNTPLDPAVNLSTRLGVDVLLKREDLQPVFSFKLRGAFNMMRQLPDDQKWKGVIACSAGNHAQGVALSGAHLSIPCTIVMPLNTPSIKTANVARLGAKVVLFGQDFDEAKAECSRLAEQYGLAIIPPFDEPRVIAGQGTVAVEICRQTDMSKIDAIFCCVGGGGLIAGVAAYVKRICPPHVKVIGVETYDADALARSMEKGERVTLKEVGLFSDGTAVRVVGEECFRVANELVDGIVRVGTDEICAAIRDIFEDTRSIPEPAGALAVAGMKRYVESLGLRGSKQRFVALVSGANMNFSRLRFVADRAELGDKNEVLLSVAIPEQPGSFLKLHSVIHPRAVTEFSYRYNDPDTAHIYISFQLSGKMPAGEAMPVPASGANGIPSAPVSGASTPVSAVPPTLSARARELSSILTALERLGMPATDLSDNELAKSHARYMVGGLVAPQRASQDSSRRDEQKKKVLEKERLFSFEFPERPGALRKFLTTLHPSSDITLFHYRDHGGDVAKVLAGLQVEEGAEEGFQRWLHGEGEDGLGYPWTEETDNEVYRKFWR